MPRVAVIIPWLLSDTHRAKALDWVLGRYRATFPEWEIIVEPGPTPWCKALPVITAARCCTADVLVVADADVWTTGLSTAADSVLDGAGWAIPHTLVNRLTQTATADLIAGQDAQGLDEKPYRGMPGGGIVVLPRTALLDIPLDPRFIGWGQEDESWGWALTALLGEPARQPDDLIHLWHPPQTRLSRARGNQDGWRLRRRYAQARHNPDHMRELVEEARLALAPPDAALRDHQPQPIGRH